MVNFGLQTAEICWQVWGTPANFHGFASWQRYCMALLVTSIIFKSSASSRDLISLLLADDLKIIEALSFTYSKDMIEQKNLKIRHMTLTTFIYG